MTEDTSIVVGVDASGSSDEAIEWAAEEAAVREVPLILAHAVAPPSTDWGTQDVTPERMWSAAEHLLQVKRDDVYDTHPELEVHLELSSAGRYEALLEQAERAALVVVGSHARNVIGRLFLGSTSHFMVTHATGPVAVIRQRPADRTAPVVVGVDGTESSREALDYAFDRAAERGVPLVAIHSWVADVPMGYGMFVIDSGLLTELRIAAEQRLTEALKGPSAAHPEVEVRANVVQSDPASALVRASEQAQLVVVGSHGRGGMGRLLMGSVSTNVLHAVETPIVVVRTAAKAG
jgi:nucleotide-binding universal stress UspA family protein